MDKNQCFMFSCFRSEKIIKIFRAESSGPACSEPSEFYLSRHLGFRFENFPILNRLIVRRKKNKEILFPFSRVL